MVQWVMPFLLGGGFLTEPTNHGEGFFVPRCAEDARTSEFRWGRESTKNFSGSGLNRVSEQLLRLHPHELGQLGKSARPSPTDIGDVKQATCYIVCCPIIFDPFGGVLANILH